MQGSRTIQDVVDDWLDRSDLAHSLRCQTFRDIIRETAGSLWDPDPIVTSKRWNDRIHQSHSQFEFVQDPQNDGAILHGLEMMAGCYWRMLYRKAKGEVKEFLTMGGSDRVSMAWFLDWLEA